MGGSTYSFPASLDGSVADGAGHFERAVPDEEVLHVVTSLERDVGPPCTAAPCTS